MSTSQPTLTPPSTRRYRLGLPMWIWIALTAGVSVALIQTQFADQGMANAFTWPILALAAFLCLAWFTLFSSYSRGTRWSVFGVVMLLAGALAMLVRFEGMSGNIVPVVAWRFSPRPIDREPPAPSVHSAERVDLRTTTPLDFPQFLGPKRDLAVLGIKLARDWSANPPQQVWRQPIGAGWSGFAVVNGFAVTLEQRGPMELITCYDVQTGKLMWSHGVETRYETFIGRAGPRSTPTIHQGRVYALGATGKLYCVDGNTGQKVWQQDLLKEFGLTYNEELDLVLYGRSNSPLVLDELVIVPAGGPKAGPQFSLAAFHLDNGALVWKGGDSNVSYSSPNFAVLAGVPQILSVNENTVTGHDPKTGAVLWEFPWPGVTSKDANISQAVPLPPDRVFVSKGYGAGAKLVRLKPAGEGRLDVQPIYHQRRSMKTKFTNVTIHDGHVYGLSDGILECMELETGRSVWRDGRYGHGQILRVDDLLLVLSEEGELALVEATPVRPHHVLGSIQALEGQTWNHLALYGPHLLVRNAQEAACYRLTLQNPSRSNSE